MNIDYDALSERLASDLAQNKSREVKYLLEAIRDGEIAPTPIECVWEICDYCNGDGGHSRRFGAYTMDEFEEFDDDFREGYLSGRFDERCEACDGSGKVRVIDEEQLTDEAREWLEFERESSWETASMHYHEMRAGC